jgi:hypothetical protein
MGTVTLQLAPVGGIFHDTWVVEDADPSIISGCQHVLLKAAC